jgi:hypothetical protein
MQPSLLQFQDPVAGRRQSRVVGCDDRGQPLLTVHLAQKAVERLGGVLVEIARRLICEQERRVHNEGAR